MTATITVIVSGETLLIIVVGVVVGAIELISTGCFNG